MTLLQAIREDYEITASCRCGHMTELNLVKLTMRFDSDFDCSAANLAPRLRCSKCGQKGVSLGYAVVPKPDQPSMTPEGTGTYDWWTERMKQLDDAIERTRKR